jgi:hypothetical protein
MMTDYKLLNMGVFMRENWEGPFETTDTIKCPECKNEIEVKNEWLDCKEPIKITCEFCKQKFKIKFTWEKIVSNNKKS